MATTSAHPAVVLRNLHKHFGDQQVLNGIDLTVGEGETVAILGRSGTGKSVLLKLIVGLQAPDAGSIHVHGRDMTGASSDQWNDVRTRIGFLFQEAALYDSLTIEDNVAFPLRRHQPMSETDLRDHARELLAGVGMEAALQKMPSEISGGMKKRAGLARALALDPDILLFDEPTAGLDPITASEIEALIVDLKKKRRVASVIVTHDLRAARAVADRLALVHDGQIAIDGTFEDLRQSQDEFVSRFLKLGGYPEGTG
jgi:phospholipid/cholesterol/gamma-HCH transport system ATP-binding protein